MTGSVSHKNGQGEPRDRSRKIGVYRLVREIGSGGMGVVHEAMDERTREKVALKLMHGHLLRSEELRKRFEREILVAARLEHPGIAKVFDFGEHKETPYYVMEFVEGLPLNRLRRDTILPEGDDNPTNVGRGSTTQPLPIISREEVLWVRELIQKSGGDYFVFVAGLILQVAEALGYAHEKGITHRDIKPHNLILTPEGRVKILDFGLAAAAEFETLTSTGQFLGTHGYAAPEQIDCDISSIGPQSDIYSLGVVFYELATSQLPFKGQTESAALAKVHKDPREPAKLDRDIPRGLNAVILKAVERLPKDRYASAGEFADDLRRYLEGTKVGARQGCLRWRSARFLRRRRKEVLIGASLLLVIVASIIGFGEFRSKVIEQRRRQRLAQLQRYEQLIASATDAMDRGLHAKAIPLLKEASALKKTAEVEMKLWNARRLNRLLYELGPPSGRARALAFSPNRRFLAAGYADRAVRVWDLLSGDEAFVFQEHQADLATLCFSADGRLLASSDWAGLVFVWDLVEGGSVASSVPSGLQISSMVFLRDADQLFLTDSKGCPAILDPFEKPVPRCRLHEGGDAFIGCTVQPNLAGGYFAAAGQDWAGVFDTASCDESIRISLDQGAPRSIAASASGDLLALGYSDGTVSVHRKGEGAAGATSDTGQGELVGVAFLGEERLFCCNSSGAMSVWEIGQATPLVTISNECRDLASIALSSEGKVAALVGVTGKVQLWNTEVNDVEPCVTVFSPASEVAEEGVAAVAALGFDPQGRLFAAANINGWVTVWDTSTGRIEHSFNDCNRCVTDLVFFPKGEEQLAYASFDGTIRLYDLARGEEIHRFSVEHPSLNTPVIAQSLAVSEDGLWLASGGQHATLTLWNIVSLRQIRTVGLPGHHIVADLHFPPERKNVLLSWSSDSHVRFWGVPALTPLDDWPLEGISNLRAAIGPRGDQMAVINEEGNIGVLEYKKRPETEFEVEGAKGGRVRCIRFSPDGGVLATVREDRVVRLWDIEQHREAINLPIHPEDPVRLAFDRSSPRLAVGLGNGTVWLYDFSSP